MTEKAAPPRIFHIEYVTPLRRGANGRFQPRLGSAFVKIPYGVYADGIYTLTENLARSLLTGAVEKMTVRVARPKEITPEVRASLTRWPEALSHTTEVTAVDFSR